MHFSSRHRYKKTCIKWVERAEMDIIMKKKNKLTETTKRLLVFLLAVSFSLTAACNFLESNQIQKSQSNGNQPQQEKDEAKTAVQQAFSDYLEQVFQAEIVSSTLNMHYTLAHPENYGITEYQITYGQATSEQTVEASAILENWKYNLKNFEKEELTIPQQMTYDIMMDFIEEEVSAEKYNYYQEPLKPTTGIQSQLPVLLAEYTFYDEQDVKDYLELLGCTPDYFSGIVNFEKKKAQKGLFMSEFAAEDVITQCRNFTENPEDNYMLSTFDDRVDAMEEISPEMAEEYKIQNRELVTQQIIPAYNKLADEIEALKDTGKNSQGLCYLENGKDYYTYLVACTTGSDMSVEEMQKQTEKQRSKDMSELAELLKKNPGIAKKSADYSIPTEDPTKILEDIQGKMQQDFPATPDTSFTIKFVHPSLEKYTAPAFYLTPPIDDISQNSIYINGSNHYEKMQLYTTLAHEGFPGHLYQNVMERSCGLEPIRSLFGSNGYAEGWATYVEMMSYYYADIDKDLAAFLQKNQSALLSLYATTDMGIHYEGWSLADTIDFFGSYKITDKEAITKIYQLIVEEPAHYLKYYIGYLEFLKLKEYAMETYGENYSNYKFHQALMKMGNAPFPILKEYLSKYWEN